ncbi:MAG: hypothetical protein HKN92_09350 [Chitinophagales bacterium]|nr:hypothetical protein [Chitinophagales bacterium]
MIRRVLTCCLFLLLTISNYSFSQIFEIEEEPDSNTVIIPEEEEFIEEAQAKEARTDSIYRGGVMIIAYKPKYYLSDADREIMEVSDDGPDETRGFFRYKMEESLYLNFRRYFSTISLMLDTSVRSDEDLVKVHSLSNYSYEKPVIRGFQKLKELKEWRTQLRESDDGHDDSRMTPQSRTTRGDDEYLNVRISDPEILKELHDYYGVGRFVFINQFEIKTNYNICLDIARKIYQRQLLLHYSIFDHKGNQIAGNFAVADFPEGNNNNPKAIADITFPKAAQVIRAELER